MKTSAKQKTLRLVQLALLIALIFVMQYLGTVATSALKGVGVELSFVLIPIVVGAFLLGPVEGAILGFVFGAMTVIMTVMAPSSSMYIIFDANPVLFTLLAIAKAVLAGFGSGLIYKALGKVFKGRFNYVRTLIASASAPIINTAIYLLGMTCFFSGVISEKFSGGQNVFIFLVLLIWVNFAIELGINIVLTPAIVRIVDVIGKKKQ